jgi:MoaA/NifB/PqqE/SkfB family radical SAM enzyme
MNVLFVNPPIRLPRVFAHYPMFSTLGMLSNAAWVRERGHAVRVVDAFTHSERLGIRPDGGSFRHVGAEVDELAEAARAVAGEMREPLAVVVALTMFSDMNRMSENLVGPAVSALRLALPRASIGLADLYVCGMNYFPYPVEATLGAIQEADWLLVGEAEPTLPELLHRLERGVSLAGLPRCAWRDRARGSLEHDAAAPEPIESLDALPPPAFDLLDMDRYFATLADAIRADLVHEYHVPERQVPLMTSRSCPFRCNFCTNQVLGLPWRAHSVEYVRRVVADLRARWAVDRFLFLDDNINVEQERFRALVRGLAEDGVPWDAVNGFRADRLDRETIRAIKAAGNTKVTVSAESGDPELLRSTIRKGLKLSSVVQVARICAEEWIPLQVHYIVGIPGETKAQINKTLELATMLFEEHGAWPLLQHAIPFPGTRLFRDCEQKGYFVAPPFEIPGDVLELESVLRTEEFEPGEVVRMKRNAQHLHAAIQALVHLEVQARCDQGCLACHCGPRGEGQEPEPGREPLRERMRWARFLGGRELVLGGGEPTLREDLAEIVSEARALGFERVGLVTHAQHLADAAIAARLLAGVDRLVVDLHAARAAEHDAVVGSDGAFARTVEGLRQAMRIGVRTVEIAAAVTRRNLAALPALVRFAWALRLQGVHLVIPRPGTRAARERLVPAWPEARGVLLEATGQARRGFATIQGAPLCLVPERPGTVRPSPPWVLRASRPDKAKPEVCKGCVAYVLCGGPYRPEHDGAYGFADHLNGAGA